MTNDPDGDYENLSDEIHFYHIGTEKAPEDVIPIYSADYEAVSKGLREDGFFYEEDSEKAAYCKLKMERRKIRRFGTRFTSRRRTIKPVSSIYRNPFRMGGAWQDGFIT